MLATKSNSYTFQKSGVWYFSRRVPNDLRRHYRTGRIAYSLRTKSIRDARVRAMSDAAKLKTKEYRIHCAPRKQCEQTCYNKCQHVKQFHHCFVPPDIAISG